VNAYCCLLAFVSLLACLLAFVCSIEPITVITTCSLTNSTPPLLPLSHSPWGEHEIDYVLFYTIPNKDALTIKGHPDEVDDVKWVSQEELQIMFDDSSLLFSPWFRLICQRWMVGPDGWWSNLKESMSPKSKYMDYTTIHRFDPPTEHLGGGGNAGLQFGDDGEK
jgi:hypothetical protein